MGRQDIPNVISFLRILLTIPVVWALLEQQFLIALILFFVAGFSDALDGFLAKQFHWQTKLGGMIDPLADKILLVSAFLCLGGLGLLPPWLVVLVILRDLLIVSGVLVYTLQVGQFNAEPSLISKLNTLLQIVLVLIVVLNQDIFLIQNNLIEITIYSVAITTLLSAIGYLVEWRSKTKAIG